MNKSNFKIIKRKGFYELKDITNNIQILTRKYTLGTNISWEKNIKICNLERSPLENLVIGDNVFIGRNTTIIVSSLSILDYTKINNHFYAYGNHPLNIGYNCWFGSSVILDTLGGLRIGNNVGIGSQTQIYSHAKFGDTLFGCKINSFTPISIGDDVWIAPNSTITSASMSNKSMLLAGSVLAQETEKNHIYSGVPAQDITNKLGNQFETNLNYHKIYLKLNKYLKQFYKIHPEFKSQNLKIEMEMPKNIHPKFSYFIVKERMYIKRGIQAEIAFIKFLLPDKAKFIPYTTNL